MNLNDTIESLKQSLSDLTVASNMVADHAANGAAINKEMKSVREQVETEFQSLEEQTGKQFRAVAGVVLAELYYGTSGRDRGRTALRKACSRGIKIGNETLKLTFPRKWEASATVTVQLITPEVTSDLDKLKGSIGGLSDGELNSLIIECRELAAARKETAVEADTARHLIAAAMEEASQVA